MEAVHQTEDNSRKAYESIINDPGILALQKQIAKIAESSVMPMMKFRTEADFELYYKNDQAFKVINKLQEEINKRHNYILGQFGLSPENLTGVTRDGIVTI